MLLGPKAPIEGVRQWLRDPIRPLILFGPAGCGKNHVLETIGEALEMQAETHEDPLTAMDNARHPTFGGNGRYAVVDDADFISGRIWSRIAKALPHAPPTAILAQSLHSVPYQVRKSCVVIELKRPSESHMRSMLGEHPLSADIAKTAKSWRQAITAATIGVVPNTEDLGFVHARDQAKAVLAGHLTHDFDTHPLSVLGMAHHNGTPPEQVARGLMMHSHAWDIDHLSAVSRRYIATLRSDRQDNPPYRL
jgi:ABC-type uncharacterized transport system YnjBCD ATPase subunit